MLGRPDRRTVGLVVVLAVLLVAVVVPRSLGQSIAGSPTAGPVPGPPAIGDCAQLPPGGWNASTPARGDLIYPPVATGPCSARRNGEVIAVLSASEVVRPRQSADADGSPPDPNAERCAAELNGYLGLPAAGAPTAQTAWHPLSTLKTAVAGPTELQRAFGQHWLTCIAYVTGSDAAGRESVPYDRSLRFGYTTGQLPRAAAQCLVTADPQLAATVACSAPHQAELFGSGSSALPATAMTPTCSELVRHLTGMTDPTAGGALSVRTGQQRVQIFTVDPAGSPGSFRPAGETSIPVCLVALAAHHALVGPLVDLGDRPVPWG